MLFILLNDVRSRASVIFLFTWLEIFLTLVPWFLLNFVGVDGLIMDGWYFTCVLRILIAFG